MSIQNEIDRIKGNVADAYAAVAEKGGTLPEEQTSDNLAAAVRGIPAGGPVNWEDINGRPDLSSVSQMKAVPITLQHSLWDKSSRQIVPAGFVVSDENKQLIVVAPKRTSRSIFRSCGIECTDQEDGALVFECKSVPEENVMVNVFIFEAAEIKFQEADFVWWSPHMTGNDAPAPYAAAASSVLSSGAPAWYAFDGIQDTNNTNYWHSSGDDPHPWISFCFGKKTVVKGLQIAARVYGGAGIMPGYGVIEGSDDGSGWEEIASFSGWERVDDGRTETVLFDAYANYSYYRIANMNPGYCGFSEVYFYRLESEVAG